MTDELRETVNLLLEYDDSKGGLLWRARPRSMFGRDKDFTNWNSRYSGKIAGSTDRCGYLQININGKNHMAHRLLWLLAYGSFPNGFLDHIDMNKKNNSLWNLRVATKSQNSFNKTGRTGLKGASYRPKNKKWQAMIGKEYLGLFETEALAHDAYMQAARLRCGEFARA